MDKFRVGQRVQIVATNKFNTDLLGKVGEVIEPRSMRFYGKQHYSSEHNVYFRYLPEYAYKVLLADGLRVNCQEFAIKKLDDGDVPVAWSTCAWRPRELVN